MATNTTPYPAPSEYIIDAALAVIDNILREYVERKELWRFRVPVNYHVTEVLSAKTPPEHRTGTAITGRVCFVFGELQGINPLPDEATNKLRQKIDDLLSEPSLKPPA